MDPLPGTQLTDMWMANPWMFDPTQKSNQFSNYNNAPLPYPPTYNGAPVNAATGQPIQSFLNWQAANPGGVTLNQTPPAPAQPNNDAYNQVMASLASRGMFNTPSSNPRVTNSAWQRPPTIAPNQPAAAPAAQPQASGPPNNWMAALNALANPGKVQTPGAQIPAGGAQPGWGFQPAGGVNAAWLSQAGAGQGMNQGFLSALRAIQNRPQP